MTVKELIGQLSRFNSDALVYSLCKGDNPFESENPVENVYEIKSYRDDEAVYIEFT